MSEKKYIFFDGVGKFKGGFCDRLKGMYASYCLANAMGYDFYYDFPYPVALYLLNYKQPKNSDFTEINVIDWDNYLKHEERIKNLNFENRNLKIHTNIDFTKNFETKISFKDFVNLFFDLKKFKEDNNIFKYDVGIHIRCGGKMVEWNDYDFGQTFDENAFKEKLIKVCSQTDKEYYICSDSYEVLKIADSLNIKNLSTSPHTPKHIDRASSVSEADYISTFYDLLTLSECELIYHTQGEFAKTAAKLNNNELRSF
jgi:hypothetical protein